MANFTTQKIVFGALLIAVLGSSSAALAGSIDLNNALNSALEERASVTAEYKSNEAADHPDNHFNERAFKPRMELTINGELNGSGAGENLKDSDRSNRVYRDKHVQAKLDKEVESVDRAYAKDSTPKSNQDKADGFQYSGAKLPR